jgi:asparagine synthase (glutamine-hydrolysing)
MTEIISHRGPDDEGYYTDAHAALGFRRLSIIDLTTGHQPMCNEDGSIWIVFNGEIYNFHEIKPILEQKGHVFKTHSDTEVIVHAYEEWGVGCLDRLNGMFGFAIWNKNNRVLFIARDRLGVKPIYYTWLDQTLVFGSEIKSILQFPGVKKEVDHEALDSYMSFLWTPEPRTLFKNISKLPSGHYLLLEDEKLTIQQYWDVSFQPDTTKSEKYWIDHAEELLSQSVKSRMISDVPLGAFLSGGVDSTSIIALMNRHSSEQITTYTIGFSEKDLRSDVVQSDVEYARIATKSLRVDYNEIILSPKVVDLLPKLVWHMDEPVADPAAITTYLICKASREKLTVLLSGVGGDEVFGGYPRFVAMKIADLYHRFPASIRHKVIEKIVQTLHASKSPAFRNIKKFVKSASLPPRDRYMGYRTYFTEDEKKNLYTADLQRTLSNLQSDPLKEHHDFFDRVSGLDVLAQTMYVDLKTFLPSLNLMYTDKMSMAASIEVREPFLDYQMVEFFACMPSKYKLKGFTRKYILKKAAERFIPKEIVWRKKAGFGAPIRSWITGDLKDMVHDLLSEERIRRRGYFNYDYCKRIKEEEFSGKEYYSNHIWQLLTFELWHQQYMDPN